MILRLVKLSISAAVRSFDWVAERFCNLMGVDRPVATVVLYYHTVRPFQRRRFARQMDILLRHAEPVSAEQLEKTERGTRRAAVTFDDGFRSFFENALPELTRRNIEATIFIPTGYLGRGPGWLNDDDPRTHETVMDANTLQSLSESVSVGSHGVTHTRFTLLEEAEARQEMRWSKDCLEKILGKRVATFSFPHGVFKESHVNLAREAGYERVFSIAPVPACSGEYVTGRVSVDPGDWHVEFRLKLLGAYRWLPLASLLKSRFLNGMGTGILSSMGKA